MNKFACLGLWLGAVCLVGCSTSGSKNKDKDPGMSMAGSGGSGTKPAAGSGGSAVGSGTKKEGSGCTNDADCASGLGCVVSPVDSMTGFRVCARRCNDDPECMPEEKCRTLTSKPSDAHCWNLVMEAFKPCGPAATAVCGGTLECILMSPGQGQVPEGVCVNFCQVPGGKPIDDPSVIAQCPGDQSCLKLADPDVGLCGKAAARGATCGVDVGLLCSDKDICITDISNNAVGDSKCYQDCTSGEMCDAGKTCTDIGGLSICQ